MVTIEQSDSMKAEREMVKALKARKEALEEALAKKTEELKRLCYEEGELTGVLPHDTPPLAPGEPVPTFRRRVGTAFSLSVKDKADDQEETQLSSDLSKLELEVELQGKITSAALRLAGDKTVSKYVRKQRRQSYTRSVGKLKDMEKKLGDMRRQMGKPVSDHHHHHPHHHHHRGLKDDVHMSGFSTICQASMTPSDDDQRHRTALSPSHSSPQLSYGPPGSHHNLAGHPNHHPDDSPSSTPPTYSNLDSLDRGVVGSGGVVGGGGTLTAASSGSINSGGGGGGGSGISGSSKDPSAVVNPHYPLHHQPYRLDGSHDSGFSSANNMYQHVNSNSISNSNPNSQSKVASSSSPSPHFVGKDQLLRSPASMSEPGFISPLQHQYGHDDEKYNNGSNCRSELQQQSQQQQRLMYSPERVRNSNNNSSNNSTSGGGSSNALGDIGVGESNQSQYSNVNSGGGGSGNTIKGSSSNSSIHYGSLDRQQIRNYNSKGSGGGGGGYHRDASPMRYHHRRDHHGGSSNSVGSAGSNRDRSTPTTYQDVVHPSNVILEVPVHHDSLRSSPSSSQRSASRPDLDQLRVGGGDSGGSSSCGSSDVVYNPSQCYSPRYQEGSVAAMYNDGDTTPVQQHPHHHHQQQHHHHPTYSGNEEGNVMYHPIHNISQTNSTNNLYTGHPNSSHRIERSASPSRPQYHPQSSSASPSIHPPPNHNHLHRISPSPSTSSSLSGGGGGGSSVFLDKIPQPEFYQQQKQLSSSTSSSPSPSSSSLNSYPRTIPIQHVDSATTPTPSSPTNSLYSPQQTSSSQSSPRGSTSSTPTSHASSSLVTSPHPLQPHLEVTKPYEMSDFYRYSEKLRRQRIIDQYQRQLIGNVEKLSRSSTPQSLEGSDGGHSSHSSSSSHQLPPSSSSNFTNMPPPPHPPSSSLSSRGPTVQYGRSSSAPLTLLPGQRQQPQHPPPPYHHQQQHRQYDPVTSSSSSSSSYSVKSQGPAGHASSHYAYQSSSTYSRVQQIHSMYQSPQPMTCKPVKAPLPKHDQDN